MELLTRKYSKKITYPIYYLAYGSNLNKNQMNERCPGAEPDGVFVLKKARLFFRFYADIIPSQNSSIQLGVWKIKKNHEKALDRYEGYPKYYEKIYWTIKQKKNNLPALIYFMNKTHRHYSHNGTMPSNSYVETIRQGYRDFGLNAKYINDALIYTEKMSKNI